MSVYDRPSNPYDLGNARPGGSSNPYKKDKGGGGGVHNSGWSVYGGQGVHDGGGIGGGSNYGNMPSLPAVQITKHNVGRFLAIFGAIFMATLSAYFLCEIEPPKFLQLLPVRGLMSSWLTWFLPLWGFWLGFCFYAKNEFENYQADLKEAEIAESKRAAGGYE
jgi:hypothetical protein